MEAWAGLEGEARVEGVELGLDGEDGSEEC